MRVMVRAALSPSPLRPEGWKFHRDKLPYLSSNDGLTPLAPYDI